jgi:carboxymethylenebutenolidase
MGHMIELISKDHFKNHAYVAKPTGQAKGAVVVLQEIFGVNAHIRAVADGYANEGYLAIAPAMFSREKMDVELGYQPEDMKSGAALKASIEALEQPGVLPDIQAAVDWAAHESQGKVAVVGYCWGGLLTWRSACLLDGVCAAAAYYGGGMTVEPALSLKPQAPTIAHFADKDKHITLESVEMFKTRHPEVTVYLYEADHGFNCDHRGAYESHAAALAKQRTLAFFAEKLA